MLNDEVSKFINKENLLQKDCNYLLALSGGADSVALFRVLLDQGYKFEAVHCNFHLRGEESDNDERFCKELCDRYNVTIHLSHFDTKTYAELHKVSIEMAARELRYNYFEQLRKDLDFDAVCVAHHKDDSVETVLLNLVRGTGVDGLKGILPKNEYIVRPLLSVSRSDIETYLNIIKQDYVVDKSNLIPDVQRNKIRLKVIPLLKEINTSAAENIYKASENIRNILPILEDAVTQSVKRVSSESSALLRINIDLLLNEPSPEIILWNLLKYKNFSSSQVSQIYDNIGAQSGREWNSNSHTLLFDRGYILVEPTIQQIDFEKKIPENGIYVFDNKFKLKFINQQIDESFNIAKEPYIITLDAEKIEFPLTLRKIRVGDWFVPFGMKGKKLLSDFLTDRKVSAFEKKRQLVLTDCHGSIVWVVGIRPDDRFRITPNSKKALLISFSNFSV